MRLHTRLESITDIMRLKIHPWLERMDGSANTQFTIHHSKPVIYKTKKVYFIHLIISLSPGKKSRRESFAHYRILLDQKGINRIELLKSESI